MFRPVRRSLEAACKLGFLEYLVRVSTSEEEVVASARALSGKLAGKVVEIRQSFQREIYHLEDKVSLYDVETMTEAAIAVVMLELNGTKLIRKAIEPETGEHWPVLYLFAAEDYMCLLYTPEMTYLDKYDPITGKAKETLVSPMLMDTYRTGLYQNRTRKTIAVQTDIQLTDSFEVSDDGEETKAAGSLASKSLFVPLLRRTIMKEKNREIEFGRKTEGPPQAGSPGKLEIRQIVAEKAAEGRASVGSSGLFGVLRATISGKEAKSEEKGVQDTPLTARSGKAGEMAVERVKDDAVFPLPKAKQESPAPKSSAKVQETHKPPSFFETKGEETASLIEEVPLGQEQSEPQSPSQAPSKPVPQKPASSAGSSIFGGERKSVNPVKSRPEAAVQPAVATKAEPVKAAAKQQPSSEVKRTPALDSSDSEESPDYMRDTAKPLSPPAEIVEVNAKKRTPVQTAADDTPPQSYEDVYEEHKDFSHVASRFQGQNLNELNENESLGSDSDHEDKPTPRKSTTKVNIIPAFDSELHVDKHEDGEEEEEEEEEYNVNDGPESSVEGETKGRPKKAATRGDSDDEDFKPTVKVLSKPRDECQCVLQ